MRITVAAIQMNSRDDKAANIAAAETGIAEAAERGASLVALPEVWTYLGPARGIRPSAEPIPGPLTDRLAALAQRHGITLLAGSFYEAPAGAADDRVYNTSVLFKSNGEIAAMYRKLHLFDAAPLDGDTPYRESDDVAAGNEIVTATVSEVRLGLAICYDLRFPELFRALAVHGAEMLMLPSAFTRETGVAHWEPLVRARSIENGCFVVAPGQTGPRPPDRYTWGHSMIVDPWGTILAEAGETPEVITAEIDLDEVTRARQRIPALANRRRDIFG
jgi:predicted amidohydrolase